MPTATPLFARKASWRSSRCTNRAEVCHETHRDECSLGMLLQNTRKTPFSHTHHKRAAASAGLPLVASDEKRVRFRQWFACKYFSNKLVAPGLSRLAALGILCSKASNFHFSARRTACGADWSALGRSGFGCFCCDQKCRCSMQFRLGWTP
jgi:hypothetical protein